MLYPLNLNLSNRVCVIIGGGQVAERKAKGLLAAQACVTVIAPKITQTLDRLAKEHRLTWIEAPYQSGMLAALKPLLVFCTADSLAANHQAAEEARAMGALVNAAAQPEKTDFQVPSRIDRGDLLLTVATSGGSPALSRLLRERLESEYPKSFAVFAERLKKIRSEVKKLPGGSRLHQRIWRDVLNQHVIDLVRDGQLDQAEEEIRHGIIDAGIEP